MKVVHQLSCLVSSYLHGDLTVCFCHVTCAYQSKPTLYSYLNFKELLPRGRSQIGSAKDCNWTPTHNQLVIKGKINHLVELTELFSCIGSPFLDGAFECMFLSCHIRV